MRVIPTSIAAVCLLVAASSPPQASISWPATTLATRAQAWFAQQTASEDEARAFLREHFAPQALAETPIEPRLERRRAMLERTGGLVPLEVLSGDESALAVRARDASGEEVVVRVEGEAAPPHRILAVRVERGGPGEARDGGLRAEPPLGDAEVVSRIVAHLDARARADSFAGVALLARGGRPVLLRAWGLADRARKTPMEPATRINLGSIGKLFTRVALAQLAERGKLRLDDTLSRYLPDFPHAGAITLDMLAEHRSGIGDFFNARYDTMDHARLRHNRDYLALIRDQPLWFEPGTGRRYSNGGYVLLGEVIARASGEDYYDYLERHVFSTAGMKATAALIEGSGSRDVARGYTRAGDPREWRDNVASRPARGSAAGGSYSTAADLLALDRALTGARLCGPAWSAWVTGGPRPDRGGGLDAGPLAFAVAGGAPGIASEWMHEGDLTLIVLTNLDPEVSSATMEEVRALFRRMRT